MKYYLEYEWGLNAKIKLVLLEGADLHHVARKQTGLNQIYFQSCNGVLLLGFLSQAYTWLQLCLFYKFVFVFLQLTCDQICTQKLYSEITVKF